LTFIGGRHGRDEESLDKPRHFAYVDTSSDRPARPAALIGSEQPIPFSMLQFARLPRRLPRASFVARRPISATAHIKSDALFTVWCTLSSRSFISLGLQHRDTPYNNPQVCLVTFSLFLSRSQRFSTR
jgi:hypothetical protein